MFQKAILTGCSSKYEENIPWWISKIRKQTDIPLIFADFGLSTEAKNFVKKNCQGVLNFNVSSENFFWGLKQIAFSACTDIAEKLLWIDQDCEIIGSIEPLFELCSLDTDFCISKDLPTLRYPNEEKIYHNQFQAGLFLSSPKHPIIQEWKRLLETENNDQKAISSILNTSSSYRQGLKIIPWNLHCPRLCLEQQIRASGKIPNIIHWTGFIGDEILKSRMILENFYQEREE